jgi:hypothetical protein
MKYFWQYYAVVFAVAFLIDAAAIIKIHRIDRIRRRQIARARRDYLRSMPIDVTGRRVEPSWPISIGSYVTERDQ